LDTSDENSPPAFYLRGGSGAICTTKTDWADFLKRGHIKEEACAELAQRRL
jgi:hypothetical protein